MNAAGGSGSQAGHDQRTAPEWLLRLVTFEPGEWRSALLGALYFFFLLCGYFILRPIRDELGVAAGTDRLPWLFTGTLIATLALSPLFSMLVARFPARRFIPVSYRFFALCLVGFWAGVTYLDPSHARWMSPTFFIWTSVFNLFVVSVFWGFMADTFRTDQGKRLFGFIGVGGTLGALAGSAITAFLATTLGTAALLLVSAVFIECAVQAVRRFPPSFREETRRSEDSRQAIGGSSFEGITGVLRSPYLIGICAYMLLFTIGSTVLYFQQAEIVGAVFSERDERTAFLGKLDFAVQSLTVLSQLFITGKVIRWLGVGITLALIPMMSVIGFAALGAWPVLAVFVVFQVTRRGGSYAFSTPAREVLYTVVSREEKYKAKNFIDTFVYRAGDQIGAWGFAGLQALGLAATGIAFAAVPISAFWVATAFWLGKQQVQRQTALEAPAEPTPAAA